MRQSGHKRKASYERGQYGKSYYKKAKSGPSSEGMIDPGFTRKEGFYGRYNYGAGSTELKFFDVGQQDQNATNTGTIVESVNNISQGVNESQRVGRKATVKSIHMRFDCNLTSRNNIANPPPGDTIRIMVYWDKQTNGDAATVNNLLADDPGTAGRSYRSWSNLNNKGRFVTLMDKFITINPQNYTTDTSGDPPVIDYSKGNEYHWCEFHKKVNIPIEFSGSTGNQQEIRTNNIGVLFITHNDVITVDWNSRIRYVDN